MLVVNVVDVRVEVSVVVVGPVAVGNPVTPQQEQAEEKREVEVGP